MKRVVCVIAVLASVVSASAETNVESVFNCQVSYTILNGYKVEQKVQITVPTKGRDLAIWLVERKKGEFKKLAYPIGGEGELPHHAAFQQGKIRHLSFHPHMAALRPLSPHGVFPVEKAFAHRRRA